jgi:invasion protein IalB
MTKIFQAFTISLCLLTSLSAAQGQTTTTETTPAPADAATPVAPAPTDLSMGTPVAAGLPSQTEAEVGMTYLAANFEGWEQQCVKKEDGSDPCQLWQLLKDADGNPTGEFSVVNLPDGSQAAAGATFIAPLETLLTANLKIAIDGKQPKIYPFAFCNQAGCFARLGFTADELAGLKKGKKAVFTIVPAIDPSKTVALDLNLAGFTKGYEAVKTANTPK